MTAARLVPSSRSARGPAAAAAGALLAVAAWAGWSALDPAEPATPALALAPATLPSTRPATTAPVASNDGVPTPAPVSRAPPPVARALPVVPDGFVLDHGQLTAVRAPAGRTAAALSVPSVALPAGVAPEDVAVSPAGIVAVTRAGAAPAGANVPPRPVAMTQSP